MGNDPGIAAFGLDQANDAGLFRPVNFGIQADWEYAAIRSPAVVRALYGMFLDNHIEVAAVFDRFHEVVSHVRVIGESHLRGHEPAHPAQRLLPKNGAKMMLPGPDIQAKIARRRGGRDGVAPRSAQPFHTSSIARVAGDGPQGVDHIVGPHLAKPMEQRAREVDHYRAGFCPRPSTGG